MLARLGERFPALGDLRSIYRVRDTGINYNRASVAARILYDGAQQHPRDLPRYRGRCFTRYTDIARGGWLRHDACSLLQAGETLSLDTATYALPEKIVLRQTADRPICTLDRTGMALGRSVIAISKEGEASLLPLLAVLNSTVVATLYRALSGEEGRILPQVKVGRLLRLPIPIPAGAVNGPWDKADLDPDASLAPWTRLGELAASRLDDAEPNEAVETEIERTVAALYALTESEAVTLGRGSAALAPVE
jgi:hypothetical protein